MIRLPLAIAVGIALGQIAPPTTGDTIAAHIGTLTPDPIWHPVTPARPVAMLLSVTVPRAAMSTPLRSGVSVVPFASRRSVSPFQLPTFSANASCCQAPLTTFKSQIRPPGEAPTVTYCRP